MPSIRDDSRCSSSLDSHDILRENGMLYVISEHYIFTIIPIINDDFNSIIRRLRNLLSALKDIDQCIANEDVYSEIKKFMMHTVDSQLVALEAELKKTHAMLSEQKYQILKIEGSIEWQRSFYTNAVIVVIFFMLILSIWFAFIRVAPVASAIVTAVATGIKALESLVKTTLDKKAKLNQLKEMIKMMKHGELLMTYKFIIVREQLNKCLTELLLMSEIAASTSQAKREKEEIKFEIIKNMMSSIHYVKNKTKLYLKNIDRFEMDFLGLITKD